MATYVLLHGAASDAWYWHRVVPLLEARGHEVVAVDLPCDDDSAGFAEYADVVVEAIGDRRDVILVGQSLAGFTAPLVASRVPVDLMVLVAAMVPEAGASPGEWWAATGHAEAMRAKGEREGWWDEGGEAFDPQVIFLHDVPQAVIEESVHHLKDQSGTPFEKPYPLDRWPEVPTRFLLCRDDRFFPADFQRRVVQDRLGITPDEMDGGHLPALAHPEELVTWLERYRAEVVT